MKTATVSTLDRRPSCLAVRIELLIAFVLIAIMAAAGAAPINAGRTAGQTSSGSKSAQRSVKERNSPEKSRSLTGRVLGDGGQPAAEASVLAVPAGIMDRSSLGGLLNQRNSSTDEAGRFAIEDLGPGAYTLQAFSPGFVAAPTAGEPVYYRPGDNVTLNLIKGGVITGAVTTPNGDPITGIRIRATMARDLDGRQPRIKTFNPLLLEEWKTDDRGVYRIFGLEPGYYVVSAGGKGLVNASLEVFDDDAPTYYPSGTRDTAVEVQVHTGEEITGVDIRYRENRGHTISGVVSGATRASMFNSVFLVTLSHAATKTVYSLSLGMGSASANSFQFDATPDGEYYLTAMTGYGSEEMLSSPVRRVEVKGSDVTGLDLPLSPLGSIAGHVVLEKAPAPDPKACPPKPVALIGETVVLARGEAKTKNSSNPALALVFAMTPNRFDAVPDDKGDFRVRPLESGRYRLQAALPVDDWFIKAISLPAPAQTTQPVDAGRNGIGVKAGEQVKGVTILVAQGAAGFRGRVVSGRPGESLPAKLKVFLAPAEKEAADDVLRYFETQVEGDGSFAIKHIPPGRYFLLAKEQPYNQGNDPDSEPISWNADSRGKLRREAEAANMAIDLVLCQRVNEYLWRYTPTPAGAGKK